MVVRIWRGRAQGQGAEAYLAHVSTAVFPRLATIDGFVGGRVLRRSLAGSVEFLVITEWASWDAIRAFAGERLDEAVVEREARAVLTAFDQHVEHFEVALVANPS